MATLGDAGETGQGPVGTLPSALTDTVMASRTRDVDPRTKKVGMKISTTNVTEGETVTLTFTREEPRDSNLLPLMVTYVNEGGGTSTVDFPKEETVVKVERTINISRYGTVTLEVVENEEYYVDPANASVNLLIRPKQARPDGKLVLTDQPPLPPVQEPPPTQEDGTTTEEVEPPTVPALDRAPEVGETIRADTSAIIDQGGLTYRFTNFVWWYNTPIDKRRVVVQEGRDDEYTMRVGDIGQRIHVRAEFVTTPLGYTGGFDANTEVVLGQGESGVSGLWLSPPNGTLDDEIYGCDEDLRVRMLVSGGVPRGSLTRALARLRIRIGSRERTMHKVGLPAYKENKPSTIAENDNSFEFSYQVGSDDRGSSVQVLEMFLDPNNQGVNDWPEGFDPSFAPVTLEATVDGRVAGSSTGGTQSKCPSSTNRGNGTTTRTDDPETETPSGKAKAAPAPLTARFENAPSEHDGSNPFSVDIVFSEAPKGMKNRTLKRALSVVGGTVQKVRRIGGDKAHRTVRIGPAGTGDVTIALAPTTDCGATNALCTNDGGKLDNGLATRVRGPVQISVSNARVYESPGATLDFQVKLSRTTGGEVMVGYRTSDITASAGSDYTARSGSLTFAPGDTSKTLAVEVLDDVIDEGDETIRVTIYGATGTNVRLGRDTATGTIVNSDPMPQAWNVRFGRTVASQAVASIENRLQAVPDSNVTLGGHRLGMSGTHPGIEDRGTGQPAESVLTLDGREALLASSFHLSTGERADAFNWTAWGRFSAAGFRARDDALRLDANVTSGFVGADVEGDRWLAGLALSRSEGSGNLGFDGATRTEGDIQSTLTAIYPYARWKVTPGWDVWGMIGTGSGELKLGMDRTYRTDITMRMGAIGTRGEVISSNEPDGASIAVKSDMLWVRMDSDRVDGLMESRAKVGRVRVAVEGTRSFEVDGARLTPAFEVGVRHDAGDAETGTGLEAGVSIRYAKGRLSVEGSLRTLVAHRNSQYEEWGASGALRIKPGASGRGFSFSIVPSWGLSEGGAGNVWSIGNENELEQGIDPQSRLTTELAYGIGAAYAPGVLTPYAGMTLGERETALRGGVRWRLAPELLLGLEASRTASLGTALVAWARVEF